MGHYQALLEEMLNQKKKNSLVVVRDVVRVK